MVLVGLLPKNKDRSIKILGRVIAGPKKIETVED